MSGSDTETEASPDMNKDILKKFDKEADYRNYSGIMARAVSAIAIVFSCFQLYTAVVGVLDALLKR